MEKNRVALNLYIPQSVGDRLRALAEKEERSMSWIVRKAIIEYLDKRVPEERGE